MPGYVPPAPKVVLEGDYSTWTVYDSFDDTYVADIRYDQAAVVNKDEGIILLVDGANIGLRKYTIATKTLGAVMEAYDSPTTLTPGCVEATTISILATYVVALITGTLLGNGIAVWKNGDIIKTLSASDLGLTANTVCSVHISKSGKYIIISGTRSATGNRGWVVLVGS